MARFTGCLSAMLLAFGGTKAVACVPPMPEPLEVVARELAENGVLIDGTVVRSFDASKDQSEIIRVDKVYIGRSDARNFVIYRSKFDFEMKLGLIKGLKVCGEFKTYPEGYKFKNLLLEPAGGRDNAANGRWSFAQPGHLMTHGRGLDLLISEAESAGRLQSRPLPHCNVC